MTRFLFIYGIQVVITDAAFSPAPVPERRIFHLFMEFSEFHRHLVPPYCSRHTNRMVFHLFAKSIKIAIGAYQTSVCFVGAQRFSFP
jgi:hypothetical protein